MPRIDVLPHESLCPGGKSIDAPAGQNLAQVLLDAGIDLEHACGLVCACTTCHVIVKQGLQSLAMASDQEDDMLDRAWGLTPRSRLSCQVQIGDEPLQIELPKYTINHAREEG
ncbi:MAG: ISC system 2Fe-2S type ferredoxin [Betaproteobacteria bacterium]|jgi:2Fe-2S ferredoxin|nr:ISC system 2Fe-2S type ferredoxin [Pseudomonadota bacterium]NBO03143.1 ISC system 2Fe-2S type ferredoxin [Betaproteobacteria bacterium]HAB48385.1 ISC system 2Fe-2S type ferredoxin [Lautropia sp.]NBO95021.1 ISC system 2Fe-2S type ferredoxin [Betaproteobacteria bacterium]NBP37450.1 ISC system 2Fe-2S type ferredoxin [Betaproteobacteria bacterium]